jgi:gliding motility-associated-like protein
MPTTVMKECDDDGDGAFPFDVSTITSEVLNGQSLADVTITYFNVDGTQITGVVNSSLPNPFTTHSQTIDIVVTINTPNDPDGACSEATTLTFVVDASPTNNVQPIPAACETDPEDGLLIATFDTSNIESSINAQAGMDITYLDSNGDPLQDMDGNLIVSPFPNSFTTETQIITVVVTNPANTTCPASVDIDFTVNPRPVFDDLDEEIVCANLLPHTITIENPDASNYDYEWFNASDATGTSIGNSQILEINSLLIDDITPQGVVYSVKVTNPTTGCERIKNVNLKKSSIATLLDTDIVTIEFNSPSNSIEIITTNLGFGDYEYALEHDADARPWQDEPIFTDLQGGMYTVLISDKNGCGEIFKVLFLLDYPKFLTPNNDGINDYWQLIGLESTTYTVSPIQIFDRFGKIVAIIDPIKGQGWDGFYNNEMLPSSDYWFALSITNNSGETIVKKGNFSLIRR